MPTCVLNNLIVQILLFGSENYYSSANKIIISSVIEFIIKSKRFEDALIFDPMVKLTSLFNQNVLMILLFTINWFCDFFVPFDYLILPSLFRFSRPIPLAISLFALRRYGLI